MKNALTLICLVSLMTGAAQQGWYVEGKTEAKMRGMSMSKMTYKIWSVPGKSLMETDMPLNKEPVRTLTLENEETMTMGKDCYHDTKENIRKVRDKKSNIVNIKVQKESDTKIILGYACKKAILKYDAINEHGSVETESEVWYSEDLMGEGISMGSQGETGFTEYAWALEDLGVVLESESVTMSVKIISRVTKIEKREIPDEKFTLSTENCKKLMNYEEYQEEMDKRRRQEALMDNMQRQHHGFGSFPH